MEDGDNGARSGTSVSRVNAPADCFEMTFEIAGDYGAGPIHGQTSPSAVLT